MRIAAVDWAGWHALCKNVHKLVLRCREDASQEGTVWREGVVRLAGRERHLWDNVSHRVLRLWVLYAWMVIDVRAPNRLTE